MKRAISIGVGCLLAILSIVSRLTGQVFQPEVEYMLLFEDAVGNKDTVIVGHDHSIDPPWGFGATFMDTTDIGPMDSIFGVRVNSRNLMDSPLYRGPKNYKRVVTGFSSRDNPRCYIPSFFEIYIHALNPPVTMKFSRKIDGLVLESCDITPVILYSELFSLLEPEQFPIPDSTYDCFDINTEEEFELVLDHEQIRKYGYNTLDSFYVEGKGWTQIGTMRMYWLVVQDIVYPWKHCQTEALTSVEIDINEEQKRAWISKNGISTNFSFDDYLLYDLNGNIIGNSNNFPRKIESEIQGLYIIVFRDQGRNIHTQKIYF